MTKLSNAKKTNKLSLNLSKRVALDASDVSFSDMTTSEILDTLKGDEAEAFETFVSSVGQGETVVRTALDASDLRSNEHSLAGIDVDYSLENNAVDLVNFASSAVSENGGTVIEPVDPMAPYAHHMVKLSYVFDGMELDMGRIFRGWDASKEAHDRANDAKGPKVPVAIRCATSNELFFTAYPVKGARNVSVVSGTRQTSTRTVANAGMSEEEKARKEEERQRKEEERAAKAWDAMVDAAEKENAKFDAQREKQIKEMAAKLAKAQAKLMRHPKTDSDAYNNFLLLTREIGATCKELNHEHNVRSGLNNANFGWKQIALDMEKKFTYRLIAMGRQCQVAEKKGLSEAMRLIDRDLEIPAGWVDISRF